MKQNPVTKEDLKEILDDYPTKPQVEDLFTKFRDEIFERLDDISGQLETIRDEQTIGFHQYKELEKRVGILESSHS